MFNQNSWCYLEIRLSETLVLKIPILQFLVVPDAMSIHKIQKRNIWGYWNFVTESNYFVSHQKCMNESVVDGVGSCRSSTGYDTLQF